MYDCKECVERLYPFLDRELNEAEQLEVRQHLDRCSGCRHRFTFEGNVLHLVGQVARATSCPDDTRQRILRACGRKVS